MVAAGESLLQSTGNSFNKMFIQYHNDDDDDDGSNGIIANFELTWAHSYRLDTIPK